MARRSRSSWLEPRRPRRGVAEAGLAPFVVVVAPSRVQALGGEDVVEPVTGLANRARVHHPGDILSLPAVQLAKDVDEVPLGEPHEQAALGGVPTLLPLGVIGGEGLHLAGVGLVAGDVEVAAEDPLALTLTGEGVVEGLARRDLDEAVRGSRWDVGVVDFDGTGRRLADRRQHTLGLRRSDRGQLRELPARSGQVEQAPAVAKAARVHGVAEAGIGQSTAPGVGRARPDLLQRYDVGPEPR